RGQSSLEYDPRGSAHAGNARKARRALRAQRVHARCRLERRLLRPVGRGAGQGAGPAHHPGARGQGGAAARPRQLHERSHPALPDAEGSRAMTSKVSSVSNAPKDRATRSETARFQEQLDKMKTHPGFIAALDQSGGSTPHALEAYGIAKDAWKNE